MLTGFAETGNEDKEHYYDEFINEFADWLETQDELVTKLNEYRNQPFDVEYYFGEYLNDYDADHTAIEAMYEAVDEWVEGEEEFAESPEYLDRMYKYEAGRELGLLNGEAVNKDEPPVYDADTPTF